MRNARFALASAVLTAALAGCGDNNGDPPVQTDASLRRFSSCGDMREYVADAYLEELVRSRYSAWRDVQADDSAAPESDGDSGGDGPSDYSQTNTQEAGVDEADIVKTDGQYVYVVQDAWYRGEGELTIVDSWPVEDASLAGRVAVEGYPYSMFLDGDQAVVFSYVYDRSSWYGYGYEDAPQDGTADDMGYRGGYATRMTFIDVSDRTNPRISKEIDIEAYLSDARMIDGRVYAVTNAWSYVPQELWDLVYGENPVELPEAENYWEMSEDKQAQIRAEAREILRPHVAQVVDGMDMQDILPRQFAHASGEVVEPEPLLSCSDIYHPEGISSPSILSVVQVDLGDSDPEASATGLLASGWQVYASRDNLYVAQSSWWWWWGWGDVDHTTQIHKFSLTGDEVSYTASGEVGGWINDQFSMSEYDGDLRVATTDMDWWWGTGTDEDAGNNVFVLREEDGALGTIGSLTGLAPGEQIQSARFLGDKAYLVTFRQVDPLFAIDLSDPTAPVLKGELKIPGFSSYLHPYGGDRLIGVGMDGTEDGQLLGLAINLFDISDMTNPTLLEKITVESDDWSWSEAMWDHHAFTLHRDVLSLPLYTWTCDNDYESCDSFSGIMSIAVSADGIDEIGRVDHKDLVAQSECMYGYYDGGEFVEYCNENDYWYAQVRRSVVIEDNLLSISNYGIKVTDLNDPSAEIAQVVFHPN